MGKVVVVRRLLLALVVLLSAMAPLGGAAEPSLALAQGATPCPTTTPEQNTALAERFHLEAFNHADLTVFDDILAPDIVYRAATSAPKSDIPGVKATFQTLFDAFPGIQHQIVTTVAEGDLVGVAYTVEGVNTGPFRGAAPTGRPTTWTGNMIYRVACGRIAEMWNHIDQIRLLQQLGMLPMEHMDAAMAMPAGTPVACADAADRPAVEQAVRGWLATESGGGASMLAPDVAFRRMTGGEVIGAEGAEMSAAAWRTAMPDLTFAADALIVQGDLAAVRWSASGTDTGGVMGNPPTGKRATWDGIDLYRVACGRIVEIWSQGNVLGLLDQLGLMPSDLVAMSPDGPATPAP